MSMNAKPRPKWIYEYEATSGFMSTKLQYIHSYESLQDSTLHALHLYSHLDFIGSWSLAMFMMLEYTPREDDNKISGN